MKYFLVVTSQQLTWGAFYADTEEACRAWYANDCARKGWLFVAVVSMPKEV